MKWPWFKRCANGHRCKGDICWTCERAHFKPQDAALTHYLFGKP